MRNLNVRARGAGAMLAIGLLLMSGAVQADTRLTSGRWQSGTIAQSREIDYFYLDVQQGERYRFETSLGSLRDSVLILFRGTQLLAEDDDGGSGLASRIDWTADRAGRIRVGVRGFGTQVGSYALRAQLLQAASIPVSRLSLGQWSSGVIGRSGEQDLFHLSVVGGRRYVIETQLSGLRDSILEVRRGSTRIARNDDSGGSLASRIEMRAERNETLTIVVLGYSTATGSYRVRAQEAVAAPAPTPAPPSHGTTSRSHTMRAGNTQAGAQANLYGYVSNTSALGYVYLNAYAHIDLLERRYQALSAYAYMRNTSTYRRTGVYVRLAGRTLVSDYRSLSWTWSRSLSTVFAQATGVVTVGPVPVTLSASASGGMRSRLGLGLTSRGVRADGSIGSWANGAASAGIGIPGYNVSIQADLDLFDTTFEADVTADFDRRTGRLIVRVVPVELLFSLVVNAWPLTWQRELMSFAAEAVESVLMQF